jgi:NAD(P)-dependent dehydrogenase (short-subunit alcohol dehydrogenase family)
MYQICVVDGQGGGIGAAIIRRLREVLEENVEIIGLGTNAVATSAMLKAGANRGATGENAVVRTVARTDVVIGSLALLMANAMMGEVTAPMAEAIASSEALKILIPMSQERVTLLGVATKPLPHMIDDLVEVLRQEVKEIHV